MTESDDELRVLLAKQEITEVLHRYCYARDTGDFELSAGIWHPEGTANYEGLFEGKARDFLDHPVPPGSSHQLSNIIIEVDGDRATSVSCVTSVTPVEARQVLFVMRGRFRDEWSLRDGSWRIDHREFSADGSHVMPMNPESSQVQSPG